MVDLNMPAGMTTDQRVRWLREIGAALVHETGQLSGEVEHCENHDSHSRRGSCGGLTRSASRDQITTTLTSESRAINLRSSGMRLVSPGRALRRWGGPGGGREGAGVGYPP
jgi:hypothetical protein